MSTPSETKPSTDVVETKADPTLGARRLLVFIVSAVLGTAITAGGMFIFPAMFNKPPIPLGAIVPISFFSLPLLPLTAIPFGLLALIWVDYFMGTKIVPD